MLGSTRSKSAGIAVVVALSLATGSFGCSAKEGSRKAFCARVKDLPALDEIVTGYSEADPAELSGRLERATESYADLSDAAPDEIRQSVRTLVDLVDAVIEGLGRNPDDPEATADDLRAAVLQHPGAPMAAVRVADYAAKHCGVQLNPNLDEESPTNTPGSGPSTTGASSTTVPG